MRSLIELIVTVAVAVAAAWLLQAFVVKPYRIPSGSMIPTLKIGQRILVQRIDTHPHLGQVVIFHPPAGADSMTCGNAQEGSGHAEACDQPTAQRSSETYVKRVVGMPGDRISIRDGDVYRNGHRERASYAEPCDNAPGCTFSKTITVPRGDYFMMGDNRPISDDSRYWGPVPQRWIIGTAIATYWPLDRIGIF